MTETIQTFGNMREIVEEAFPKLDILKYYPYGPRTDWSYWLCGDVDLRKQHLERYNRKRTREEMVYRIVEETGRAMNYLTCWGDHAAYDHQRVEAFCLWNLFHSGVAGWNLEAVKGKTAEEIEAMEKYQKPRIDKYYGHGKYADARQKKQEAMLMKQWKRTPESWAEHEQIELNCKVAHRRDYGIFEITHFPLRRFSNCSSEPVIFYTKQELAAILLMVDCAFENLC